MKKTTTRKRTAKKRGPLSSCAAKLGSRGGKATARKRRTKASRRTAKAKRSRQLSFL